MDPLIQDVKHAVRRLRRSPGFALVAAATLALGIGGNAAMLTALEALVLRPLPFPDPDRLVIVEQTDRRVGPRAVAPANFLDWRERSRSFEGLAAYETMGRTLLAGETPLRVAVGVVSSNFFELLGTRAAQGRVFVDSPRSPEATTPSGDGGGDPVLREAVLSHALWRTRFASDASVVGREVRLDDEIVRVVGVMPADFAFPREAELWLRARHDVPEVSIAPRMDPRPIRDARYLAVLGRLAPGVALGAARAEMDQVAAGLAREYPDANEGNGAQVTLLFDELRGGARPALALLLAAAGCVLVVACANVANLLLARAVARRQEMAVRAALGAGRARLVRQLLTEALVLVALGGGLGLLLAAGARPLLVAFWPTSLPPLEGLTLAGPVLGLSSLVALLAVVLVGLVPAREAARTDVVAGLRASGRSTGAGREAHRARGVLVVAEVAVAVVLVSGAFLLLASLRRLQEAPLGFRVEHALTARLSLPRSLSGDAPALRAFAAELEARLKAQPGVTAASLGQTLPLSGRRTSAGLRVRGREVSPNDQLDVCWRLVAPSWFEALGTRVLRGRGFDGHDTAEGERVAIVNATLARQVFGAEDPIGRHIGTGLDGPPPTWVTIVGVVADTPQENVAEAVRPEMYRPLAQDSRMGPSALSVVLRGTGAESALAPALPRLVAGLRGDVAVSDVRPLETLVRDSIAAPRAASGVLGLFGALALLLAALGLYGVVSCLVGERRHEMGVRLALGARPASLVRLILGRSLALAGAGLAVGLPAALALSRFLKGLLFEVSPADPSALGAVAAVLLGATLLAAWLPARRAGALDPADVLRAD